MKPYPTVLKNATPELIIALVFILCSPNASTFFSVWILCLLGAFSLRLIWNLSISIHGLGHVLATAILDRDLSFIKIENILEHRSLYSVLVSCIPLSPIFLPLIGSSEHPWVDVGKANPWTVRVKAFGGILFNAIALSLVLLIKPSVLISLYYPLEPLEIAVDSFLAIAFASTNLLIILTSVSDIAAVITGEAACLNCGNFGFLGERLPTDGRELLPARVTDIFHAMGQETEIRGEQAGGGATFARLSGASLDENQRDRIIFVGDKVVNLKRQNLTQSLESTFSNTRRKAKRLGAKPLARSIVGMWHYRYATSSAPSLIETHWHEWVAERETDVWRVERGRWLCDSQVVNHRITHNGDFEAWRLFGQAIDNAQLGLWLERVLHTPSKTVGDSPKIAGMMDLLITQGMWDASLRLAYQLAIADSVESAFDGQLPADAAPNTAPSIQAIQSWAAIAERIFLKHQSNLLRPYAKSILELSKKHLAYFEQELGRALSQDSIVRQWPPAKQAAFVKNALYAFFHNNSYQATKLFMSRAEGTFGLVVASTLNEKNLVLSSWGQPIATGFNVQDNYMVYASEPAAVDAVLASVPRAYRLDLNQKSGEVAWVGADSIAVYSIQKDRELLTSELEQRWIPFQNNPYILPPKPVAKDPVEQDIKDIPRVLAEIVSSWQDPASFNRQSADYLAERLIEKAKVWAQRQQTTVSTNLNQAVPYERSLDLLITGVESSLWLGEQFGQDLNTLFPGLRVETISANQVLKKVQEGFSGLPLDEASIVLAISHSGQTFPTLQATNAFEELRSQKEIGELFVMTGELCSLMGSAIAQYYYPDSAFTRRIFVNGSGRRSAEPMTVVACATHSTLTELLFYLAHRLQQQSSSRQRPFGTSLTADNLFVLDRIKGDFLKQTAVAISGTTVDGETIKSSTYQSLVRSGRKWALPIIETPTAWAIHALYITITVGLNAPLLQTLFRWLVASAHLPNLLLLLPIVRLGDIFIYVFGIWLWTVGLRYFQGRPLFARTGKRTLIVGDVRWVHRLLKAYVSKLFSLSYGIASLDVHSANPQDHMLHHYGHRVVRGTLVFLGIPDGHRHPMTKADERAVIMTGKQAMGVQNARAGAEIVTISRSRSTDRAIARRGFQETIVLPNHSNLSAQLNTLKTPLPAAFEKLQESRFGAYERLLAGYVFFWALAKRVSSFPLLRYQHWKSQSRTQIMTTAAPVSRRSL